MQRCAIAVSRRPPHNIAANPRLRLRRRPPAAAPRQPSLPPPLTHRRSRPRVAAAEDAPPPPDWDAELSIFRRRTLKPNQLEALRLAAEARVDVGRVLAVEGGVAVVEGLNNDAGVGTELRFASGAAGALMWRRADNLVFALLLAGAELVTVGDGVECRVAGILQVLDEAEGPATKREYAAAAAPAGSALAGAVVDHLGRPLGADGAAPAALGAPPLGADLLVPLFAAPPDMESRECLNEALFTGVRALDVLTPLGRGQALQLSGPPGGGKTALALDAIIGQRGAGVRCVYAALGGERASVAAAVAALRAGGAMAYTTVVAAPGDRPLGEQFAALLAALAIGEAERDAGGAALVVLDDVGVAARVWERITAAVARVGGAADAVAARDAREAAEARAVLREAAVSSSSEDAAAEAGAGANKKGADAAAADGGADDGDDLVEYEGMLVSAAAAQRRRFLSSIVQRAAKMHRRLRGGSLTALLVVPGAPATGRARAARARAAAHATLAPAQKAKLLAALEAREADEAAGAGAANAATSSSDPAGRALRTEVVEEFMSICDGQAVVGAAPDPATGGAVVDPAASVSRIGTRAYPPALRDLAPAVRFELAQAQDALRFGGGGAAARRAAAVAAALPQARGATTPLEALVVRLLALRRGLLDAAPPAEVPARLDALAAAVAARAPGALREVAETRRLSAAAEAEILAALDAEVGAAAST